MTAWLTADGERQRATVDVTLQPITVLQRKISGEPVRWHRWGAPQPVTLLLGIGGFGPAAPIDVPCWQDGCRVRDVGLFDGDARLLVWYRLQRLADQPGETFRIPSDWTVSST